MEWAILFTVFAFQGAKVTFCILEYLKPPLPVARGGFTPRERELWDRVMERSLREGNLVDTQEWPSPERSTEKVNWKQEGF